MRRHRTARSRQGFNFDFTKPPDADHPLGSIEVMHLDNGDQVTVHYDVLPDKDCTVVDGIPVTTALRTVIDLAPELATDHLSRVVTDCLERQLFSMDEALSRIAEDDMRHRHGAQLLADELHRRS